MASSVLLLLFVVIKLVFGYFEDCEENSDCDFCLTNKDFTIGTVRIREPGIYCIKENIYFNPSAGNIHIPNAYGSWYPSNDDKYPGCSTSSNGAFALGFFAAISIESSNVELDLNGHTIQMHYYFYLQQRFFSIIEIASSPFLPNSGPANFGNDWVSVQNVTIRNGELGLSSHHGIHSNNATDIIIQNLRINQFEVAGIALNGFKNVLLQNIEIGPSFDKVPFTGHYSNARYLIQPFRALLTEIHNRQKPIPYISFAYLDEGESISLEQIYSNLVTAMDIAFRYATQMSTDYDRAHSLYANALDLFVNNDGLPDGSALYGIVLHSQNVAVGGFGQHLNADGHGENIVLTNVSIHDLKLNTNEVSAMYFDKCEQNGLDSTVTVLKGPFGDVIDIRKMINSDFVKVIDEYDITENKKDLLNKLRYEGNPLSDAQIALYSYRYYIADYVNYAFGSYINPHFLSWAVRDEYGEHYFNYESVIPSCVDFICNGDVMMHTNKGVIAIRFDLIENAEIIDVSIHNLLNASPLASCTCGNYSGPHDGGIPGMRERQGTMTTDMRGISIFGGDVLMDGERNIITNLRSDNGDVTGIDLMSDAILEFSFDSNLKIGKLQSAVKVDEDTYKKLVKINKTPYPNNFEMVYINIGDESEVINEANIDFFDTYLPKHMRKYTDTPTYEPTHSPTSQPTEEPTFDPTIKPSFIPTAQPVLDTTVVPTFEPTHNPTVIPTHTPTVMPTFEPSADPTMEPTHDPSNEPTTEPTSEPTEKPTVIPTTDPIEAPTWIPTPNPTWIPTPEPTYRPTYMPSYLKRLKL